MKARLLALGLWSTTIVDNVLMYKVVSLFTKDKFCDEIFLLRNIYNVFYKAETYYCKALEDMGYDVCVSPNHRCQRMIIFRPVEALLEDQAAAEEEPIILSNLTDEEYDRWWDQWEQEWNEKRMSYPWYLR